MKFLFLTLAEEWEQPGLLGHSPNLTSIYPPLGLMYIGAVLEQDGHKVEIVDLGAESYAKDNLKKHLALADAVGISVYTNSYNNARKISEIIKELKSEVPIIIGGPHCTFLKQQSLKDIPKADIAIELEGEEVIKDLVLFLQGRKNLSDISGVHYRVGNSIKSGKTYKIIKDLDLLPFPARHLVNKYDYGNFPWGYQTKKRFTSMLTSRGCTSLCRFCARYSNVIPGYGFRQRSAENVVEEIQKISRNYRSVSIVDDNFLADKKRSHKIFDMLLETGTNIDIIIVGARVDSADRTLYKKMKKAGVTYISFGIESGNQEVLDFYNKNITLNQIRKAVQFGTEAGFFVSASFIFGGPIETEDHLKKSIKFACSLPLDNIVIRPFYYDMKSELWNDAVQNGKISKDEYVVPADSLRGLGNLSLDQIHEYQKKAFKRFYSRPSYLTSQIYRAFSQGDIARIKSIFHVATSSQLRNIL